MPEPLPAPTRRSILRTAAWSAPVIAVTALAGRAAASAEPAAPLITGSWTSRTIDYTVGLTGHTYRMSLPDTLTLVNDGDAATIDGYGLTGTVELPGWTGLITGPGIVAAFDATWSVGLPPLAPGDVLVLQVIASVNEFAMLEALPGPDDEAWFHVRIVVDGVPSPPEILNVPIQIVDVTATPATLDVSTTTTIVAATVGGRVIEAQLPTTVELVNAGPGPTAAPLTLTFSSVYGTLTPTVVDPAGGTGAGVTLADGLPPGASIAIGLEFDVDWVRVLDEMQLETATADELSITTGDPNTTVATGIAVWFDDRTPV